MVLTRRKVLIAAVAAPSLAIPAAARTQTPESAMSINVTTGPRGPANRSLAALERSWVRSRFYMEAMMEEGRVPRDRWEKAKLNAIHGTFDVRDPDNGDLLQTVEKGVRLPVPPPSPRRPSSVH